MTGQAEAKSRCGMMEPPLEISRGGVDYPEAVRRQGISGTVILQATLSGTGVPATIKVVQSADRALSNLALESFQTWRYKPAMCDGNPISTYVTATFSFKLKPDSGSTSRP